MKKNDKKSFGPRVGVGVLIFNREGQLLMGKRKGTDNLPGTWSVPGGHMEWGESFEEAARREVKEEVGLEVKELQVLKVNNCFQPDQDKHYVDVFVKAELMREDQTPQVMEPEKCTGWQWFEIEKLPQPIFRDYFRIYRECGLNRTMKEAAQPGIDYIGTTTAMFCHDGQGNFLLNKRSDRCRDEHGKWDAWGGRVEFGEDLEMAARRELAEECGAEVKTMKLAGVSNALRHNMDGRPTHWIVIVFLVEIKRGTEKNKEPEKFEKIEWFKAGQWPKEIHSMLVKDFEIAKRIL